jgi:hypothetical protein
MKLFLFWRIGGKTEIKFKIKNFVSEQNRNETIISNLKFQHKGYSNIHSNIDLI